MIKEYKLDLPGRYNFELTACCYALPWMWDGKILRIAIDKEIVCIRRNNRELVIKSQGELSNQQINKIRYYLGLDEDLNEFYKLCEGDKVLWSVSSVLYGMRMRAVDLWSGLLIGICQQNTSFVQGWKMLKELFRLFGEKREDFFFPPSCERIIQEKNNLQLAKVGYRQKALIEAAKAFQANYLDKIEKLSDTDAIERLCKIKGVGEYTAAICLLLSLRRYSLFPKDRWFERLLPVIYEDGIDYVRKKWREWIGLFAYFTTVVTEARPIHQAIEKVKKNKLIPTLEATYPTPLSLYKF